jgi:hypothetical protein
MTSTINSHETTAIGEEETISQRVINQVAAATGTDPLDLDPLYYSVDPDCLNSIFESDVSAPSRNSGRVQFSMAGCEVTVSADGSVDVSPPSGESATTSPAIATDTATDVPESTD